MCSSLSVAIFVICIAMVVRVTAVMARRISLRDVVVLSMAVAMCRVHGIAMVFAVVGRCFRAIGSSRVFAVRYAVAAPVIPRVFVSGTSRLVV